MSPGKKFICIVLDILLLSIVVPTTWDYYNLVEYNDMTSSSSQLLYIGEYVPAYLFWGNVILAFVLILALIIIIFYPRTYVDIKLSTQSGKLCLFNSKSYFFIDKIKKCFPRDCCIIFFIKIFLLTTMLKLIAKDFYEHMGFEVYRKTDFDDQGNPYPLLYMKR